jgi:Protein of unknown function (DUF2530)
VSTAAPPPQRREAPDTAPAAPPAPRRAVEPLEVDAVVVMGAGTILWGVALVVLVLLRGTLDRHDAGWWVWVAVAGVGIGLAGLWSATRRRARLRAAGGRAPADAQ